MKKLILIAFSFLSFAACSHSEKSPSPQASAEKIVTVGLDTPESAYFDAASGLIFVSNVSGAPNKKDGQGWISKLDVHGNVLVPQWVKGLNAPKGLRSHAGILWVSDLDQVLAIDMASGTIRHRVRIKGAKFLNDIAIAPSGAVPEVYVSDMVTDKIHVVRGTRASVFASGDQLEHPNGLLVVGEQLIVAGWGRDMKADFSTSEPGHLYSLNLKTKKKTLITASPLGNLDGLEIRADGSFLVSDWVAGKVYSVSSTGTPTLLFQGEKGSADIGWIESSKTLLIPWMMGNKLSIRTL